MNNLIPEIVYYSDYSPPNDQELYEILVYWGFEVEPNQSKLKVDVWLTLENLNTNEKTNVLKTQTVFSFKLPVNISHEHLMWVFRYAHNAMANHEVIDFGDRDTIQNLHPTDFDQLHELNRPLINDLVNLFLKMNNTDGK